MGVGHQPHGRMTCKRFSWRGQVEDIPLLWEAKHASFDSSFVIDAAYFFTNGFEETINYVKSLQIEDRDEILKYLENSY